MKAKIRFHFTSGESMSFPVETIEEARKILDSLETNTWIRISPDFRIRSFSIEYGQAVEISDKEYEGLLRR